MNPATGAVTLRAVFPNPDGLLMPGMYVRAVLETGVNEQALLVPQQGVTRDTAGNASVLLVNAENKVERRKIQVEAAVGNRWQAVGAWPPATAWWWTGCSVKVGDTVKPVEVAAKAAAAPAGGASSASSAAPAAAPAASGAAAPAAR